MNLFKGFARVLKSQNMRLIGTVLFVTACGGGGSVSVAPVTEDIVVDATTVNKKMDILWVVDCSISMQQEIQRVQKNILSFAKFYINTGYDFRIGVISTSAWSQYHYDAETNRILNPGNTLYEVDGTNGVQNEFIPGLNILHSGQAIKDLDTPLTNAPILNLTHITQDDKDAVNTDFCDCRYQDFNYDGDFDDTVSTGFIQETYAGHELDLDGDGDAFDKVNGVSEATWGIDFNRDGDMLDTVNNVFETVEPWSVDLNGDGDTLDVVSAASFPSTEADCDDPGTTSCVDISAWVASHPNSFLAKFNSNVDVYGIANGDNHCGYLNKGGNFDTGLSTLHGDEREFQSVMAFIQRGDASVALAQAEEADPSTTGSRRVYWNQFTGTDWANSSPLSFFRSDAYLAVIMITDEIDGSRSQMDFQTDNGPVDNISAGNAPHYPQSCPGGVTPCSEPAPSYVSEATFLNFLTAFKSGSTDLYGVYAITKTSNNAQFKVLRDAADHSGGFSVNIDNQYYDQHLERISANIIEASSIYPLASDPIPETVSVSFTYNDGSGNVTVNIPKDVSETDGFNYYPAGNYIKIFGTTYLPPQDSELSINYTPVNLSN